MKKMLFLLLLILFVFPLGAEEEQALKLSLEECLKIAETESFPAIFAGIEARDIDLITQSNWFYLLPELGYRVYYGQEKHTYTYLGEEDDPAVTLPYYYDGTEYISIYDDSITNKQDIKQELFLNLTLYSSEVIDAIQQEKSKVLRKNIIQDRLKDYVTDQVKRKYFLIILYQEAIKRLDELEKIIKEPPRTTAQMKAFLSSIQRNNILDLEEDKKSYRTELERIKRSLLYLLMRPLDSALELKSPLPIITLNPEEDKKRALENCIPLKYILLEKQRIQGDLKSSTLDYLPKLFVSLDSDLTDSLNIGIQGTFNSSSDYWIKLTSGLLLDDRNLVKETVIPQEQSTGPEWSMKDDLNFSIELSYSPDSIFKANNKRTRLKSNLLYWETRIKEQVNIVLWELADAEGNITDYQQTLQLREEQLKEYKVQKSIIDKEFELSALSDLTDYNNLIAQIERGYRFVTSYRRDIYLAYLYYLDIVEG